MIQQPISKQSMKHGSNKLLNFSSNDKAV